MSEATKLSIIKPTVDMKIFRDDDKTAGLIPAGTVVYVYGSAQVDENTTKYQVDLAGKCFVYHSVVENGISTADIIQSDTTIEDISNQIQSIDKTMRCTVKNGKLLYGPANYFYSCRNVNKGEKFHCDHIFNGYIHVTKNNFEGYISSADMEDITEATFNPNKAVVEKAVEVKAPDPITYAEDVRTTEEQAASTITEEDINNLAVLSFLVDTDEKEARLTNFISNSANSMYVAYISKRDQGGFDTIAPEFPSVIPFGIERHMYLVVPKDRAIEYKKFFLTKGFKPTVHTRG